MYMNEEQETCLSCILWKIAAGTKAVRRGRCGLKGEKVKVRSEGQNKIQWEEKFCEMIPKQGAETYACWVWRREAMTKSGKLDWDLGLESQLAEKQRLHPYLLALQHIFGPSFPGHLNYHTCWDTLQLPSSTLMWVSNPAWSWGITKHALRHGNWEAVLGPTV